MKTVFDIRHQFAGLLATKGTDEKGMLEICGAQFIADEDSIFGKPNHNWHARELSWYVSQSRNVNDIPAPVPEIWKQVAASDGTINSNYGWCIFSDENGNQLGRAIDHLIEDRYSRHAIMIYTRPSMHWEATEMGRRDFMCTNTVQALIRDGKLDYYVNMRSSDAVFGYKGDLAWHKFVQNEMVELLDLEGVEVEKGKIIWNAVSFHIYPRHVGLVSDWDIENWERGMAK